MRLKMALLSSGALALLIGFSLFGGIASAATPAQTGTPSAPGAADNPQHRVRIVGRVEQVGERGILLSTRRGPVRVAVGERTVIMVPQDGECVRGELSDIQTGRPALVVGVVREPGVVLARGIAQCRPEAEKAPPAQP